MSRDRQRLTGVVIGAGDRGSHAYAPYLLDHPEIGGFVAVAEPRQARRDAFARRFELPSSGRFEDYQALFAQGKLADFAIVATPDPDHVEPAIEAMRRGYHVLLEKPMALTETDCRELVRVAEQTGVILQICHVLRYAPLFAALKQLIASGEIGDVVTIQHSENVSYWHYAHSYCRGNWRNRDASSPMILAKSCHDLDLLYWLADSDPVRLTSLARPTELCEEHAPPDAPEFCLDGCPHESRCPYHAGAMYLEMAPVLLDAAHTRRPRAARPLIDAFRRHRARIDRLGLKRLRGIAPWTGWPLSAITDDPSPAGIEHALRTTRYGRCVYRIGDNDQVSSQTVNVSFANGVNASFTMHSTSYREGREIRVDGSRGSIVGRFYNLEQSLEWFDHKSGRRREMSFPLRLAPHGGSDPRLFADFVRAVRGESQPITTAAQSLQSHLMAFAADRAQREGRLIELGS